ncbi:methyl-accepting chemotaxis protein [Simplicispira suum]|uniref:Methyl-accepting chemotaxis protein n=1 Tax=Simplicispira suum TaxID=2109915 RepID=A0A2S0N2Q4_9BURK|nr:methyl-accepting chemotaxis protein [Simplicispira suum]AVO42203.1 methyl-accepting chemotaxis protein [Simplicispira suum]
MQLRIAHKLWFSVLAIVVMLAGVVGFAGVRSARAQIESDQITAAMKLRVDEAVRWMGLADSQAARTQAIIISNDSAVEDALKGAMDATTARMAEVRKTIEALPLLDADRAQLAKVTAAHKAVDDAFAQTRQLKLAGQIPELVEFMEKTYTPAADTYLKALADFVQLQQQTEQEQLQRIAASRVMTIRVGIAAMVLVILAICAGAFLLIRSIRRPLQQANELAAHIAAGDLSRHQDVQRKDEFGDLLRSLYAMSASLAGTVQRVRQSTDSIATASAEIASGNHDLSARTEQTSSNLQQTAAAMDQFTSTIAQSAGSAQQASSLAAGATGVARRGGEVVTQVVNTMNEINQSSKKISDIIGVIDGIAFQTNILALNAAVEAARAGEQGRGFAVVASEVRSLAGRSADAAKEIKALIGASVERVETGSRLVQEAGTTMEDIVQSVQRVTDMIGEITAASTEQSSGISQVNQAVGNLDQMTQQNAALVEESAAAAQSLREQAEQLAQVVSTFKLGGAALVASPAAPLAPPRAAPLRPSVPPGKSATPPRLKVAASQAPTPTARPALRSSASAPGPAPKVASPATGAQGDWESF